MNAIASGFLAGSFLGWWFGALTALGCLAQADAYREEERQFEVALSPEGRVDG